MRAVHSDRLERWLGTERVNQLSGNMKGWYGPPINLADCPGSVWVDRHGDFYGDFDRGYFASAADSMRDYLKRFWIEAGRPIYMRDQLNVGFASISDALARASGGNSQLLNGNIIKNGPTGVVGSASSLWRIGPQPNGGSAGSAAPGGRVPVSTTTGGMRFANPSTGTLHLTGADFSASVINNSIMLYDRIFDVAKTMNSSATESVTGVPTRYQGVTAGNDNFAGGNFLFIETPSALAATAHNWTTCLYTDEAGNVNQTLPSVTGNASNIIDRFDMPLNTWFCPLATDDVGIAALDQMQCSAAVATGSINFVIGHPIGIMAFPVLGALLPFDWLTNRNQAPRIFDDACLSLLEFPKPTSVATVYSGQIYVTSAAP